MQTQGLRARTLPPFAVLRAFDTVGRCGSVRRAAVELGINHTVVSRHMKSLEQFLGIPLFAREHGRLAMTESGREYHLRISAAIVGMISATEELTFANQNGALRLWCIPGFGAQWLSARLAEFELSPGGYRVEMRPTDQAANLVNGEADADVRFYGDDWETRQESPQLSAVEIARPPFQIVGEPQLVSRLQINGIEDLPESLLLHDDNYEQWNSWLRRNGAQGNMVLGGLRFWHAHLTIAAARHGRGLALANRFLVEEDLRTGRLQELHIPGCRPTELGGYWFTAAAERLNELKIRRLREYLVECIGR